MAAAEKDRRSSASSDPARQDHDGGRGCQTQADQALHDTAAGQQFFDDDQNGDSRNPQQVHHAADEKEQHQQPAAADAVQPVLQPGDPGAGDARSEMAGQELDR